MDYTDFTVDRAQHMRPLEYDLSERYNGLLRYLHDMGVLDNLLTGTIGPSEVVTASDAITAPLRSLVVGGNSVQNGTPTPSSHVPIISTVDPIVHCGDGTTDITGWPVTIPATLRGLQDGTRDNATYTYLRPSEREGWSWYSGEITRFVGHVVLGGSQQIAVANWRPTANSVGFGYAPSVIPARKLPIDANTNLIMSDTLPWLSYGDIYTGTQDYGIANAGVNSQIFTLFLRVPHPELTTTELIDAWLADNPITVDYPLDSPTTESLTEIELPNAYGPSFTLWGTADATPTLTAEYVRDISAAINDMQEAIADI